MTVSIVRRVSLSSYVKEKKEMTDDNLRGVLEDEIAQIDAALGSKLTNFLAGA